MRVPLPQIPEPVIKALLVGDSGGVFLSQTPFPENTCVVTADFNSSATVISSGKSGLGRFVRMRQRPG